MSDFDSADAEALQRIILWDRIDITVSTSVREFAYHAEHVFLPQAKCSDEEREALSRAIQELTPTIDQLIQDLSYLKIKKPDKFRRAMLGVHSLLVSYASIGVHHAFTEVVDRAALEPVRLQRSQAGKRAADLRMVTMTAPWHSLFDPIVKQIRGERPDLLNADLIREARKTYGTQKPILPKSDRQLSTHIKDMVRRGELPAGPSDGRGRPLKK